VLILSIQFSHHQRKEIKAKISEALKNDIKPLNANFQKILIDDLVTAFQNKMNVLKRIQEKTSSNED